MEAELITNGGSSKAQIDRQCIGCQSDIAPVPVAHIDRLNDPIARVCLYCYYLWTVANSPSKDEYHQCLVCGVDVDFVTVHRFPGDEDFRSTGYGVCHEHYIDAKSTGRPIACK